MSDKLLHQTLGRALEAGRAAAPAAAPPGAAVGAAPLRAIQRGRYQRWHADADPPQEEEGWLITYLDVMTLLLVMLVVMLAFSEPITRKLPLGRSDAQGQAAVATGQPLPGGGGQIVPPVGVPVPGLGQHAGVPPAPEPPAAPAQDAPKPAAHPPAPVPDNLGKDIEVLTRDEGVSFRISSELLFASGEAALTPQGQAVIDRLLPVFNRFPDYTIVVEGHTDNIPIQTARYPSNWELAAARAGSVVRHLEARGLNPTRLRATGYADTRPIAPNSTAEGRALNRRVEITLEPPVRAARP